MESLLAKYSWVCANCVRIAKSAQRQRLGIRSLRTSAVLAQGVVPLRKQLKEQAKQKKRDAKLAAATPSNLVDARLKSWQLTVGIEVHARLNTATKLFSTAPLTSTLAADESHRRVRPFDLALPGSRPRFQTPALVPAIRAALALGCTVQRRSEWDRKHYFYQDQPNGYQITQYYKPFATNGRLLLSQYDGFSPDATAGEAEAVEIGIKQVQMEQDTAKSTRLGSSSDYMIDYTRVGAPLIEIITLPQIHTPSTAAAVVRKIRDLLKSVDACDGNMENGDLRADVNVSVQRIGTVGQGEYSGVRGLGTRTEVKNLNSFKSVEEAVTAERNRQIEILEAGGQIVGETRGWAIGDTATRRLRSKEGEVDYRYMPDPDLGPVWIDQRLVEDLRQSLPEAPDSLVKRITQDFDISIKDAITLSQLDDGERLEFVAATSQLLAEQLNGTESGSLSPDKIGKAAANWTLHEIGGLLTTSDMYWEDLAVQPKDLADILAYLTQRLITGRAAKQLLQAVFERRAESAVSVQQLMEENGLLLRPMSDSEYKSLAQSILTEHPDVVDAIQLKGQKGKIMFFVGQMMRRAEEGTVEADKARTTIEDLLSP